MEKASEIEKTANEIIPLDEKDKAILRLLQADAKRIRASSCAMPRWWIIPRSGRV